MEKLSGTSRREPSNFDGEKSQEPRLSADDELDPTS